MNNQICLWAPKDKREAGNNKVVKQKYFWRSKGNGKKDASSQYRKTDANKSHTYDENDADFMEIKDELNIFAPDSVEIMQDQLLKRLKSKRKVFGRDIFNQKNISFEPNMNIATPQNYRLGPGDAVFIDVWGASQNTFQQTISPDGTVQIEGFGPVQLSGVTVA